MNKIPRHPYTLITKWQEKHYYCALCGSDKSVKYQICIHNDSLPACNKCVLLHIDSLNEEVKAESK